MPGVVGQGRSGDSGFGIALLKNITLISLAKLLIWQFAGKIYILLTKVLSWKKNYANLKVKEKCF